MNEFQNNVASTPERRYLQNGRKVPPRPAAMPAGLLGSSRTCHGETDERFDLAPMPLFYFDVREGVRFIPDEDGLELPNLDAAEREAAEAAASIGRELLPEGTARSVTVEVRNQHGQRVITTTVTLAVDRVTPQPEPPH
jgi:hypothetical protein